MSLGRARAAGRSPSNRQKGPGFTQEQWHYAFSEEGAPRDLRALRGQTPGWVSRSSSESPARPGLSRIVPERAWWPLPGDASFDEGGAL